MKTIFMPEETMKKWLAALRCGEYKQAKGALYDETTDGYCCLGVLQHVLDGEVECTGKDEPAGVPSIEWCKNRSVKFSSSHFYHYPQLPTLECSAVTANDNGYSFLEIADALEACYGGPIGARSGK